MKQEPSNWLWLCTLEIPGRSPSYEQLHVKTKPQTLVSFLCLDHCCYIGLQSLKAWISLGNAECCNEHVKSSSIQLQACLCPEDACQVAYHLVLMTTPPWLWCHPKDGRFEQRSLLGHYCRIHTFDGLRWEWQATILQVISSLPCIDHRPPVDTTYTLL